MHSNNERHTLKSWIHQKIIVEKFNNWFGFLILLSTAIFISYVASTGGRDLSLVTLLAIAAVPIAILSAVSIKFGFYFLAIFTSFMPLIERAFYLQINAGTYIDIFIYFLLLVSLVKKFAYTKDWRFLRQPVSILLFILLGFDALQLLNPAGNPTAWFFGFRITLRLVCLYVIAESAFQSRKDVFDFLKLWFTIAMLAAIYAFYQEWIGLPSFDLDWANKNPERFNLLWMGNRFRKWSFLSDVANFGLFMSFSGMMAIFLALANLSPVKRVLLVIFGILFWVAMVYSGTRTAYAIIPIGVAVYFLMNINKIKTLIFGVVTAMAFIFIYFAPIYNPSLNRLRSAFNPDEDASMNLRDINRDRIQPYIYSHPFGGGLNTTGNAGYEYDPGHPLAGFPPDSGFLKKLLETGWLGLLLQMAFYTTVLGTAIISYHRIRDPILKRYLIAFLTAFFALTVSLYAKLSIEGFPLVLTLVVNFVLVYRLQDFDKPAMDISD
jgi:hypothetical protein